MQRKGAMVFLSGPSPNQTWCAYWEIEREGSLVQVLSLPCVCVCVCGPSLVTFKITITSSISSEMRAPQQRTDTNGH